MVSRILFVAFTVCQAVVCLNATVHAADERLHYDLPPVVQNVIDEELRQISKNGKGAPAYLEMMKDAARQAKAAYASSVSKQLPVLHDLVWAQCARTNAKLVHQTACRQKLLYTMMKDAELVNSSLKTKNTSVEAIMVDLENRNNFLVGVIQDYCDGNVTKDCATHTVSRLAGQLKGAADDMAVTFIEMARWDIARAKCSEMVRNGFCQNAQAWKTEDFVVAENDPHARYVGFPEYAASTKKGTPPPAEKDDPKKKSKPNQPPKGDPNASPLNSAAASDKKYGAKPDSKVNTTKLAGAKGGTAEEDSAAFMDQDFGSGKEENAGDDPADADIPRLGVDADAKAVAKANSKDDNKDAHIKKGDKDQAFEPWIPDSFDKSNGSGDLCASEEIAKATALLAKSKDEDIRIQIESSLFTCDAARLIAPESQTPSDVKQAVAVLAVVMSGMGKLVASADLDLEKFTTYFNWLTDTVAKLKEDGNTQLDGLHAFLEGAKARNAGAVSWVLKERKAKDSEIRRAFCPYVIKVDETYPGSMKNWPADIIPCF